MARQVNTTPPLPYPGGNATTFSLSAFDQDLVRSLTAYLSELARRANETLPVDGTEPMEGDLDMGGNDITNAARLRLTATDDAALASTLHGLQVGLTASTNIIMDNNEIMARNNGATSTLFLNVEGGTVHIGTGLLNLAGGQIAFPATANPSADANTLDDYEEGTWTPTYSPTTGAFTSITYTSTAGTYTKIGNTVHLHFRILITAMTVGTASGQLRVAGMPFSAGASTFSGATGFAIGWTAKPVRYILSSALILLYKESAVTNHTTHSVTDMNAASSNEIRCSLTYHV